MLNRRLSDEQVCELVAGSSIELEHAPDYAPPKYTLGMTQAEIWSSGWGRDLEAVFGHPDAPGGERWVREAFANQHGRIVYKADFEPAQRRGIRWQPYRNMRQEWSRLRVRPTKLELHTREPSPDAPSPNIRIIYFVLTLWPTSNVPWAVRYE